MDQYGKVALITGSSRGIGAAMADKLALNGYQVVVNYKNSLESAESLVRSIQKAGGRALAIRADVSHSGEVAGMIDEIESRLGRLDLLVNNAGIVRDSLVQNMTEKDWDEVIGTNLKGVFNCCKASIKTMKRRRWGRIISISSVTGQRGRKGQANYAAAKAGVIAFSKSLALELAPWNITVNVVVPGFTETGMTASMPEKARAKILGEIPLGRSCRPEEIAGMVCYLASEEAGYISGQIFNVDCRGA